MEHKRIISPLILAGLFAAFTVVSIMVWLRKGKSAKWISRKMKLGAAIIAITGISTGCPPQVTCYDPVPQNWFTFDSIDFNDYSIVADLPRDSILKGKVYQPTFDRYSFKIESTDSQIVDQGNVMALDGKFDQSTEDFGIAINPAVDTGIYRLHIYPQERDQEVANYEVFQIGLKIK